MCGIIAAASTRNVGKLLVQGLHKMEYRGYDSAGIALHQNESIAHLRALGKVQLLEDKMVTEKPKSKLGIAHTRWATHGEPSEANAHPHKSKDKVYIVHNGIIENYIELRESLIKDGYEFSSQTDSELIAHLLDLYLNQGSSMIDAMYLAKQQLEGAYAIAAIDIDNDENLLLLGMNTDVVIEILNKDVSVTAPSMSLRTRKDIYSAASILNIPSEDVDAFLVERVKGENFNKFIVIKETKKGPKLAWVEIGVSDLANVEIVSGLSEGDTVFILPSKSLYDYQQRFKERVNASFSFG